MSASSLRTSRPVQLTFVILLMTCLGQVAWWIFDQGAYSSEHVELMQSHFEDNATVARTLLANGESVDTVAGYFPELEFNEESSGADVVSVSADYIALLKKERRDRMARYGWEGSFFLGVLLCTVALIGVTLRQRTELLRRQQNFLAAVSHELKSPLASIQLSAETLLLRDPDKEGRIRIADRMVSATERLGNMVTNLLDAARLDEDQVELTTEVIQLHGFVERVLEPIACMGRVHGVEVENDIPAHLEIAADATAVRSVLNNVVGNAYKSVQAGGGGVIRLTAEAESEAGKPMVALQIVDNGIGFEPKLSARLFDKFFRPGSELTRKTKGAGLGLHIVQRFVALDGGRTAIHSEGEGKGATFTVWWRAPAHSEIAADGAEQDAAREDGQEMMG